ncbi:MAG: tetratricopeptide repeat protein [Pseudomonadota bacterium]
MNRLLAAIVVSLSMLPATSIWAAFTPAPVKPAEEVDADFTAAIQARNDMDWEVMIGSLNKVILRKPANDDAHALLGYGHRKLGDFEKALFHYHLSLNLNPNNRDALNYLGIAYLHMEQIELADATLEKLNAVCQAPAEGTTTSECKQRDDLASDIAFFRENGYVEERCPDDWH